jgi:hypothetical protein
MAVIGSGNLTLLDHITRLAPDGSVEQDIVEVLSQQNPIITDMAWREGNMTTGNKVIQRAGLPTVYYRILNQGVPTSKSVTAVVDEGMAIIEAYSEVDTVIARLGGDVAGTRAVEARAFLESMNQALARSLFYGNSSVTPEQFTGLSPRYSSLAANNAQNIVDAGGTGNDNMSIWLVVWGPNTVFGHFPKGARGGIIHQDLGEQMIQTTSGIPGSRMQAFVDHWQWYVGVTVKDWRYAVRVANIDVSNLVGNSTPADISALLTSAVARIPNLNMGNPVIYMNRTALLAFDKQQRNDVKSGGGLTFDNATGRTPYAFRGIPIRIEDVLLETEARVV